MYFIFVLSQLLFEYLPLIILSYLLPTESLLLTNKNGARLSNNK